MAELVRLETARSLLTLAPDMGGGIASLNAVAADGMMRPVLRPWNRRSADGPFALASNVLVPFSNRISGGGFAFGGRFHAVPPNLAGEACPIHGDGFQRSWKVGRLSPDRVELVLADGAIGPYRHAARQTIELSEHRCRQSLSVKNNGPYRLPFGLGFHPWFPRSAETAIACSASRVWLERPDHLPERAIAIEPGGEWDLSRLGPLPRHWVNNCFDGWDGHAVIAMPGLTVEITASPLLASAILYSPSATADFFCFEPISHPVDAHNLAGMPGLVALDPDEELECWMELTWH